MSWEEFMDRPLIAVERWKALYRVEKRERDREGSGSGQGMKKGRS